MAARHVIGRSLAYNDTSTNMKSVVTGLVGTKKGITVSGVIQLNGVNRGTFSVVIQTNGASVGTVDWGTIPLATYDLFNEHWYLNAIANGIGSLVSAGWS